MHHSNMDMPMPMPGHGGHGDMDMGQCDMNVSSQPHPSSIHPYTLIIKVLGISN